MQLSKTESLRQARQHISEGRVSSAMSIYQKIVDDDPSDLAAISMLGDLYVKAGRIADAAKHFLRIAETYLQSGSAISATYVLKKVLKVDPANPVAHMNLGELHFQDKKFDRAHDSFIEAGAGFWHQGNISGAIAMNRRALDMVPDSRLAKAALALIKREIGQSELPEPKKEIKREIISDEPEIIISIADGSDAVCAPGEFGYSLWQPDSASGANDSTSLAYLPARNEDAIVEQIATAEFLVGCGQVDQAIRLLREMLQDKPDDIQLREKLKDIYLRCEMIDRASEECVNIASIYIARGESSRAEDYVMRARLLSSFVEPASPLAIAPANGVTESDEVQGAIDEGAQVLSQAVRVM